MKLTVHGVPYHVDVCGEGFPLLLLHGFTGDSSTWAPFCERWCRHSTLIMPDLIGHGRTASPDDVNRYQMEAAAHDLNTIVELMGITKIDLLGYSMGGRLALTFALLFPDKVRRLILESASPGLATEEEREQRRLKDAELANFIKEKGIREFVDYWEDIPLFATMKHLPAEIREQIRNQRLNNAKIGLANSLLWMGTGSQPSWWERLSELPCEVLLITGDEDQKFCRIAEKMQARLKNGTWVTIHGAGHAIHVEDTEKLGTIISDFCQFEK